MQRLLFLCCCLWAGVLAISGCSSDQTVPPKDSPTDSASSPNSGLKPINDVELALNWLPEAEHGGFYAADVEGLFTEHQLRVKIIPGGPGVPVIQNVASGKVTFGVTNADQVLLQRAQEADVVAIFAPIQQSPRCVMVHKKSGITKFDDLTDMTLAINVNQTFLGYMKKRLPLTNVHIVPYAGSIAPFLEDERLGQQAYSFSEPFIAEQKGGDPLNLMVADLGFNPYTSVLITRAEVIEKQPELVRRMVDACRLGWRKYLDEPEKTNEHIHSLNKEMGLEILAFGTRTLKPLCEAGLSAPDRLGEMTAERWTTLTEQLVEGGALKAGEVDPAKAFDASF
ncbi:MAG: ABC transporter substrate-binding protein [Planctomycetaceae bacterium]|nr:ABC transporter substrate-binding protein [Planctomycetaceae bacterium]